MATACIAVAPSAGAVPAEAVTTSKTEGTGASAAPATPAAAKVEGKGRDGKTGKAPWANDGIPFALGRFAIEKIEPSSASPGEEVILFLRSPKGWSWGDEKPVVKVREDVAEVKGCSPTRCVVTIPPLRFQRDEEKIAAPISFVVGKSDGEANYGTAMLAVQAQPPPGLRIVDVKIDEPNVEATNVVIPGRSAMVHLSARVEYLPQYWSVQLEQKGRPPQRVRAIALPDGIQFPVPQDIPFNERLPLTLEFTDDPVGFGSVATVSEVPRPAPNTATGAPLPVTLPASLPAPDGILDSRWGFLSLAAIAASLAAIAFALRQRTGWQAAKRENEERTVPRLDWSVSKSVPAMDEPRVDAPTPPPELITACGAGSVVIVAGSMFGEASGIPPRRVLLEELLRLADRDAPSGDWRAVYEALQEDELTAADALSALLSPEKKAQYLGEVLARVKVGPSQPHQAAAGVPAAGVITTDWNDVWARTLRKTALMPTDTERFHQTFGQEDTFLLQLMGAVNRPETLLFTPHELQRVAYRNPDLERFVNSVLASNVLLFVGMTHDELEALLGSLRFEREKGARHYAVMPAVSKAREGALWTRFGIELLPCNAGTRQGETVQFLERLGEAAQVNKVEEKLRTPLSKVTLVNIGPFETLELPLSKGWNVLLGNNGCGKSSVLRAIGLGLCGDESKASDAAQSLLRASSEEGTIELHAGTTVFRTTLRRQGNRVQVVSNQITPLQAARWVVLGFPPVRGVSVNAPRGPSNETRREPNVSDLLPLLSGPVDTRLDNLKQWLINIDVLTRDSHQAAKAKRAVALRTAFFEILQELTPGTRCEFDHVDESYTVNVRTLDGVVPIDRVSQGTNSIVGWVGTLLQRLYEIHPEADDPEKRDAVVLVDEIDAHLHPEWQRLLVPLIRKRFPNLQLIATTHSPLVVGNLEQSELNTLGREGEDRRPVLRPMELSFQGWRADQILTSPAFNLVSTRSQDAETLRRDYEALLAKSDKSDAELVQLQNLECRMRTTISPNVETAAGVVALRAVQDVLEDRFKQQPLEFQQQLLEEAKRIVGETEPKSLLEEASPSGFIEAEPERAKA